MKSKHPLYSNEHMLEQEAKHSDMINVLIGLAFGAMATYLIAFA